MFLLDVNHKCTRSSILFVDIHLWEGTRRINNSFCIKEELLNTEGPSAT
eukprot:UN15032